jgi:DNA invertase Pin-like site-specific DNA recombinase
MAASFASGATPFVAYYRVSTEGQGRSGLGLEDQRAKVALRIGGENGRLIGEFTEIETGKVTDEDRPQLRLALAACRAKRAVLIVGKLDRLARNARFLLTLVEGSGEGGVIFSEIPALPPGAIGKFIITMLAAVAELEAGLISERTKAALAVVKGAIARDGSWLSRKTGNLITRLGGPNMAPGKNHVARKGRQTQSRRAEQRASDVLSFVEDAQRLGAGSLREIAARLTSWGVRPPSGGDCWHATQVRRVLKRIEQRKDHERQSQARPG